MSGTNGGFEDVDGHVKSGLLCVFACPAHLSQSNFLRQGNCSFLSTAIKHATLDKLLTYSGMFCVQSTPVSYQKEVINVCKCVFFDLHHRD